MLSVSLIRCKNEALKKLHLKSTIKCFKKAKICKWPEIPYLFLPIDCCVRINGLPDRYSVVIFSHRPHKFQNVCIPRCLMVHLNIIIQHRHQSKKKKKLNGASTMLNNVFNRSGITLFSLSLTVWSIRRPRSIAVRCDPRWRIQWSARWQ